MIGHYFAGIRVSNGIESRPWNSKGLLQGVVENWSYNPYLYSDQKTCYG